MEVPLTNSHLVAIIDDDMAHLVKGAWSLTSNGYVQCIVNRVGRPVHKLIMGIPVGSTIHIHHKDGNRLDNRKSNLTRISSGRHSSTTNRENLARLRDWAKGNGIKEWEHLPMQRLHNLKCRVERQAARTVLFRDR